MRIKCLIFIVIILVKCGLEEKKYERGGVCGHKVGFPSCNEDKIDNVVKREFNNRENLEVVIWDLTYVNVAGKWTIYVY